MNDWLHRGLVRSLILFGAEQKLRSDDQAYEIVRLKFHQIRLSTISTD